MFLALMLMSMCILRCICVTTTCSRQTMSPFIEQDQPENVLGEEVSAVNLCAALETCLGADLLVSFI